MQTRHLSAESCTVKALKHIEVQPTTLYDPEYPAMKHLEETLVDFALWFQVPNVGTVPRPWGPKWILVLDFTAQSS